MSYSSVGTIEDSPYDRLLDVQWATIIGLRDTFNLSLDKEPATYDEILDLADRLAPNLFGRRSLIGRNRESQKAKLYRQKATAKSKELGVLVTPLELLLKDIEEFRRLLMVASIAERDSMRNELASLEQARDEFQKKPLTENRLIPRDVFAGSRLPISRQGDGYLDVALPNRRIMRIRLIHPDEPEGTIGVDVLYEQHDIDEEKAHISALQYKRWSETGNRSKNGGDMKKVFYTSSDERIKCQLKKMQQAFCENGLCQALKTDADGIFYRLPHCSAFLRMTDKLQSADSSLRTTGNHIPVCVVEKAWVDTAGGHQKLTLDSIIRKSVSTDTFEELFNTDMLGSRWIAYEELEELYKKFELLAVGPKVTIHAQDFLPPKN